MHLLQCKVLFYEIDRNDLVASVEYILTNTDVKNVIVETNGLADPAEVTEVLS